MVKRESTQQWDLVPMDDEPSTYYPTFEDFAYIVDAFEASLASHGFFLTMSPFLPMTAK